MALLLLFHTKHTHFSLLQSGQLVMFGFVDFQGQRSRRGKQKVNEALPDATLERSGGHYIFLNSGLRSLILTPAVPSSSTSLKLSLSSRAVEERRGLGTGRKYAELRDALLKYLSSSSLFSRAARPGDEESVIERVRKEGDFKYFSKGKKKTNPKTNQLNQCINRRRRKGQRATNVDKKGKGPKGKAGTRSQL